MDWPGLGEVTTRELVLGVVANGTRGTAAVNRRQRYATGSWSVIGGRAQTGPQRRALAGRRRVLRAHAQQRTRAYLGHVVHLSRLEP